MSFGSVIKLVFVLVLQCAGGVLRENVAESSSSAEAQFAVFVEEYGRVYATVGERAHRFKTFKEHMVKTAQLNNLPASKGHTATFGITKFADWTDKEFRTRLLSGLETRPSRSKRTTVGGGLCKFSGKTGTPRFPYNCTYVTDPSFVNSSVPKEWDWRDTEGVITPIKNQGACGGCWAFSSTETIEAAWTLSGRRRLGNGLLSVQQILDCDPASAACCGGLPERALTYVVLAKRDGQGLISDAEYPFKCETSGCQDKCNAHSCEINQNVPMTNGTYAWVDGFCDCHFVDAEDAMAATIRWVGPMAVTVDAFPWKGYTGGIMRHHCPNTQENHAVQAVGYGVDTIEGESIPYWIVRNSWGEEWGEDGYIRIFRGEDTCGIATDATLAVVDPI